MLQAIGIDLGTDKSVVAALRRGEPQVIPNRDGSPLTPSALALGPTSELLIGQAARARALADPRQAALSFKPRVGLPPALAFNGLEYTTAELAILFLARLKEEAEAALGEPVERAVLAIPASFGERQAAALRRAARLAGLFVLRLARDPLAATLAYSREHPAGEGRTLLVYSLGGGCFGTTVLQLLGKAITVLGVAGDNRLGGDDLTESIVTYLRQRAPGEWGTYLAQSPPALQEFRLAVEQVKIALSNVEYARISLPRRTREGLPAIDEVLTRGQLEELIEPCLEETLALNKRALAAAGLAGEDVDEVLLVGGSTQIPLVRALLAEQLPRARFIRDFNPLLGVALGAATLAGMVAEIDCPICRERNRSEARTCRRCGTALVGEARVGCPRCFLPNDPRRHVCWKCSAALRSVRSRHRVARRATQVCPRCGAAVPSERRVCGVCHAPMAEAGPGGLRCRRCGLVQAPGVQTCPACGDLIAPFVGEIAGHSLGIELADGRFDVVLAAGQGVPSARPAYREFHIDNVGAVPGIPHSAAVLLRQSGGTPVREPPPPHLEIAIYEGDRPLARANVLCARLHLTPPADLAPGTPVRVAFALDADGLLAVEATLGDGSEREVEAYLEHE